jgi:Ca-activated chloride channel homolog
MTRHARFALLLVLFPMTLTAQSPPPSLDGREPGGRLEIHADGEVIPFPTLSIDVAVDVRGDLAEVVVQQVFANPVDVPIHATYLFPLPHEAAVHAMTLETGDEIVEARIMRIEAAEQTFAAAKAAGKGAALLKEHRPNLFTQEIANLMPGAPVTVTLRYAQRVPRLDGTYELVVPLVVGPRYHPATGDVPTWHEAEAIDRVPDPDEASTPRDDELEHDWPDAWAEHHDGVDASSEAAEAEVVDAPDTVAAAWELDKLPMQPPVAGIHLPERVLADRVSIALELDAGMPIEAADSPSHPLRSLPDTPSTRSFVLAHARALDNRDFVFRYRLAGEGVRVGVVDTRDERGGFFSLLIEPPALPAEATVTPREVVFVVDTSGSMAGAPLEAARAVMRQVVLGLRPTDTLRLITFSDAASELSSTPLPATAESRARAIQAINALRAGGGTEMRAGVEQAFRPSVPEGSLRLVLFLTDGYIGNEHEVLGTLARLRGDARLIGLGIGAGVNRFLITEMGREGRGFSRVIEPTEDLYRAALEIEGRMNAPLLTDVVIDWGGLDAHEVSPEPIPDLFAGQPLRLTGRYDRPGRHELAVTGTLAGRPARLPLTVTLGARDDGEAVAITWARERVRDQMAAMTRLRARPARGASEEERGEVEDELEALKEAVITLGLDFAIVTRWTAFVAVTRRVVNDQPELAVDRPVPLPKVAGVEASAYGAVAQAAPEPTSVLGLIMALGGGAWAVRRRRRERE